MNATLGARRWIRGNLWRHGKWLAWALWALIPRSLAQKQTEMRCAHNVTMPQRTSKKYGSCKSNLQVSHKLHEHWGFNKPCSARWTACQVPPRASKLTAPFANWFAKFSTPPCANIQNNSNMLPHFSGISYVYINVYTQAYTVFNLWAFSKIMKFLTTRSARLGCLAVPAFSASTNFRFASPRSCLQVHRSRWMKGSPGMFNISPHVQWVHHAEQIFMNTTGSSLSFKPGHKRRNSFPSRCLWLTNNTADVLLATKRSCEEIHNMPKPKEKASEHQAFI